MPAWVVPFASTTGNIVNVANTAQLAAAIAAAVPGDDIVCASGTYTGDYNCTVNATITDMIRIRPAAGAHCVLSSDGSFLLTGSYWRVQGFEVIGKTPDGDVACIKLVGQGCAAINNVCHQLVGATSGQGIVAFNTASGHIVYGNVVYNCRHGSYLQNDFATRGWKYLVQNIWIDVRDDGTGNQFNVHAYTQSNEVDGFHFEKNICARGDWIIGKDDGVTTPVVQDNKFINNYFYECRAAIGIDRHMDFEATSNYFGKAVFQSERSNIVNVQDNSFAGNAASQSLYQFKFRMGDPCPGSINAASVWDFNRYEGTFKGSYCAIGNFQASVNSLASFRTLTTGGGKLFDGNSSHTNTGTPADATVVMINEYDTDRAWLIIYNWSGVANKLVTLPWSAGKVLDIKDQWGTPLLTWSGGTNQLVSTPAEFNVFLLTRTTPGPQSTYYYRGDVNPGFGGGNSSLLKTQGSLNSQTYTLTPSEVEDNIAYTPAGDPGVLGTTGDYSVEIEIMTFNANVWGSVRLARVNSSAVEQATTAFSAEQNFTANTRYEFLFSNVNLGTWQVGDRFKVVYRYRNADAGATQFITRRVNTDLSEVLVPWLTGTIYTTELTETVTWSDTGTVTEFTAGGGVAGASGPIGQPPPVIACDWELGKMISKVPPHGTDAVAWLRDPTISGALMRPIYYKVVDNHLGLEPLEMVRCTITGHGGNSELTKRNSVTEVMNNPGSWVFVNNVVYLRPDMKLGFDSVFWFDNGTGNYKDESDDARTSTVADVEIKGSLNDIMYFGMETVRFEVMKAILSTAPVGGVVQWEYSTAAGWSSFTPTVLTGNINWTGGTTHIFIWAAFADWARRSDVGSLTGDNATGRPTRYWIRRRVTTGFSNPGVGTQILTAEHPDQSMIVPWFVLPVGSHGRYIDGRFYRARVFIDVESVTTHISSSQNDAHDEALVSSTVTGEGGSLSLPNGDGYFDRISGEWVIGGGRMSIRNGFDNPTSQGAFTTIRNSMVGSFSRDNRRLLLGLVNFSLRTEVDILKNFYLETDYPNMDKEKSGSPQALFMGNTEVLAQTGDTPERQFDRCLPGVLIKEGQPSGDGFIKQRWKFGSRILNPETGHLHGFGTVAAIMELRPGSNKPVVIAANNYNLLDGNTVVEFKNNYVVTGEIRMRGQGIADDPAGTFTGAANNIIAWPMDIIHFILICLSGYKTFELELATLTRLGVTKQGVAGTLSIPSSYLDQSNVYVGEQEEVQQVINRLALQMLAVVQPNNLGKIQIAQMSAASASTDPVLFRHMVGEFEEIQDDSLLLSDAFVKFRQLPSSGEYSTVKGNVTHQVGGRICTDKPAEARMNIKSSREFYVHGYTQSKMQALADALYDRFKNPITRYKVRDLYGLTIDKVLGEKIIFNMPRMVGGQQINKVAWLIDVSKNHGNGFVTFEALEAS